MPFQKWPKINFWTGKKFKTECFFVKLIYLISRVLWSVFFLFFCPIVCIQYIFKIQTSSTIEKPVLLLNFLSSTERIWVLYSLKHHFTHEKKHQFFSSIFQKIWFRVPTLSGTNYYPKIWYNVCPKYVILDYNNVVMK